MMLSDQSPSNPDKSYQTTFLNQPSAILFGSEYFAKKYNIPVLYYEVIKDKKGYYHINIQTITETPQLTSHGEITEKYIEYLEKTIKKQPEFWLWSHKRWKHKITL
jgi:KDO2-lipid IV(A) lauroyltransferase